MKLPVTDITALYASEDYAEVCKLYTELIHRDHPELTSWVLIYSGSSELLVFNRQPNAPMQQQSTRVALTKPIESWNPRDVRQILVDMDFQPQADELTLTGLNPYGFLVLDCEPNQTQASETWQAWRKLVTMQLRVISERIKLKQRARFSEETESRMAALIAELRHARQRAEEANRAKTLFLANISHELRTPLNGVLGLGEVLAHTALDNHQRNLVQTINQSSRSLQDLIDSLLDFSQIENRRLRLESEIFDLKAMVEGIVEMLRPQAKFGVGLEMEVVEPFPGFVSADPIRMRQIFMNLIGNAVKFTEVGHVKVTLRVLKMVTADEGILRFDIDDTGVGIPHDKQDRIFDAFFQADSSLSRRYDGVGLGLSIAKRLVEMMGGRLRFTSRVGLGSRFWFQIKLPISEQLDRLTPESEIAANKHSFNHTNILLVEDNFVNQMTTKRILMQLGCSAEVAANGMEALELLRDRHYDLIFMDVSMPEMDGLETTRRIRAFDARENTHTLIVALTAHAMDNDREKCLAAGMDDYLTKPARMDQIRDALFKWLK